MNALGYEQQSCTVSGAGLAGYASYTSADLIALCRGKDERAFAEIVRRYQRMVFGLLYRLAPDWRDTADIAQEVFVRVWRCIGQLRETTALKPWLRRVTINLFYDELRRRTQEVSMTLSRFDDADGMERDIPDESLAPDELCHNRQVEEIIQTAMRQLPEQFRTAIVLRELQGLTYAEIAELTGVSEGTVKSRVFRARERIRAIVEPILR